MSPIQFLALSPAPQNGEQAAGGSGPLMMNMVFIGIMVLIFYMLIWRPQSQRQKKHKQMVESLKRGDSIVTNGGLILTVKDVKEDRLVCATADNVKMEVARTAVSTVLEQSA